MSAPLMCTGLSAMNDPDLSSPFEPGSSETIENRNLSDLTKRFETRAARLEKQASIFLWIIIALLFAGAFAFLFAAEIAKFDLQAAPSLNEQYQAVDKRPDQHLDRCLDPIR